MPRISEAREREVRGRILEAGLRVFEEQGFQRASMHDVAVASGLSVGAIYTYFRSKEELFMASCDEWMTGETSHLEQKIAGVPGFVERIELAIGYFLDNVVMAEEPGSVTPGEGFLLHAWLAGAAEPGPIREMLARRRMQIVTLGRLLLRDGVARGELPAWLDVEGTAAGIAALLDGLILEHAEAGASFRREDAERHVMAVIQAILGAACCDSPPDRPVAARTVHGDGADKGRPSR